MNMSNTTTTLMPTRLTNSPPLVMLLRRSSADILTTTITTSTLVKDDFLPSCPPDRWGSRCENICKPCGLGLCNSITGQCICPTDIYGEFCDLWKGKKHSLKKFF
jgi:hypothetical protein